MLKIRLARTGKKHQEHYKIVVSEARSKRDSGATASIGHWHPHEKKLILDQKLYQEWIKRGARPTEAVRKLAAEVK